MGRLLAEIDLMRIAQYGYEKGGDSARRDFAPLVIVGLTNMAGSVNMALVRPGRLEHSLCVMFSGTLCYFGVLMCYFGVWCVPLG